MRILQSANVINWLHFALQGTMQDILSELYSRVNTSFVNRIAGKIIKIKYFYRWVKENTIIFQVILDI